MAINSKVDICNMALGHLGNFGTIEDIDSPKDSKEKTCALWYDICRETLLQMIIPNFALSRRIISKGSGVPEFGWSYYYEYPSDCLRLLGIGSVEDKENNYSIEVDSSGKKWILNAIDYEDGMPIRFIKDVKDVNRFTPEFKLLLSWHLAANIAKPISQSEEIAARIEKTLNGKMSAASGINSQENMPIRKRQSRFKMARYNDDPQIYEKL